MDILHSLLQVIIYTCVLFRAIVVVNKVNIKVYSNQFWSSQKFHLSFGLAALLDPSLLAHIFAIKSSLCQNKNPSNLVI